MPENRLESGFSAIPTHKRTPLQSNSAAGVLCVLCLFQQYELL